GKSREEKQPGHVTSRFLFQAGAQPTEQKDRPKQQADTQQDLEEPAEVKVFKALRTKPGPPALDPSANSRILAGHAPKNHHRKSEQQSVGKPMLPTRLFAGDHGNKKNSGGEKRCGNPKKRQLDVPGSRDVVGKNASQIEAKEICNL